MRINAWREVVLGAHEALDALAVSSGPLATRIRTLSQHNIDLAAELYKQRLEADKMRETIAALEATIERQNNVAPPAPTYDEYNQAVVEHKRYGRTHPHVEQNREEA